MGQKMMTFVKDIPVVDAKTFKIVLTSPTGLVLAGLGKPSSNVPFMMPKRVAATSPNEQISDYTGCGPFVFKKDEWKPGDKSVYVKFDKYKPRAEPPFPGLAGGKIAKVDRVEWGKCRRPADRDQRVDRRRDRLHRAAFARPAADIAQGSEYQARRLQPARQPVCISLQHDGQAVRQRESAAGGGAGAEPGGFSASR